MIKSLKLTNFLSFGPSSEEVSLGALNVLIGVNGSGKSNFLDALELLNSAPSSKQMVSLIREGGGAREWIWNGTEGASHAIVEAVVETFKKNSLRYVLSFSRVGQGFEVSDERVESENPRIGEKDPFFYYRYQNGRPVLSVRGEENRRILQREDIDIESSILAQRNDPDSYPEISSLAKKLTSMGFCREWTFGRNAFLRKPQRTDYPSDFPMSDLANLGLVLNRLRQIPDVKRRLLKSLKGLYEGIDDFDVRIDNGSLQIVFHEGRSLIPATRLSDGTLRYLCLLAVLHDPKPPSVICIEEPELGLHPDAVCSLGDLLREAAERSQIIVTTHSELLVDAFTETPEVVLVCEKNENGSRLKRLDPEKMKPWLERYRLGDHWLRGGIGGTRW